MAQHPFFCPGTGCTVKLQSVSEWFHTTSTAMVDLASQSTVFNIVLESSLYDIYWFPQLWCEEQFWGRLVGWCKLVGHEHDQEPLWPSVNCLCRKWYNYWCIKSRLADPDLIILGHLEIYSPEPQSSVVATLARCSLCTQPRLAQESLLHTLSWFLFIQSCFVAGNSTWPDPVQEFTFSPSKNLSDFSFEAGGSFMTFACQIWKTLIRARWLPSKTKLGCLVVTCPPH